MKKKDFEELKKKIIEALEEPRRLNFDKLMGGFFALAIGNLILLENMKMINKGEIENT